MTKHIVQTLDRSDDQLLERLWAMHERNVAAHMIAHTRTSLDEYVRETRFTWPGEVDHIAVVLDGGAPLGLARVWLPQRDNLEMAYFDLRVDPDREGEGVGSALLDWVEQTARENGRRYALGETFVPVGTREHAPERGFADHRGHTLSNVEIQRRLRLPIEAERLQRLAEAASERMGDRYDVQVHRNGVPEHYRESLCHTSNQLAADAPTGDVEFEAESTTPEDYQQLLDHEKSIGRTRLTAIAIERSTGVVAAYSDLVFTVSDPDAVQQWGTLVLSDHRGHGLGMAVKAANLRELERVAPERTFVVTCNAEVNPWMVAINVDLGFEVVEEMLAFKKDLRPDAASPADPVAADEQAVEDASPAKA